MNRTLCVLVILGLLGYAGWKMLWALYWGLAGMG